jgi:hypothetical protein
LNRHTGKPVWVRKDRWLGALCFPASNEKQNKMPNWLQIVVFIIVGFSLFWGGIYIFSCIKSGEKLTWKGLFGAIIGSMFK